MVYRIYLEGERIYGCANCKTHLATIHSMMSRVSAWKSWGGVCTCIKRASGVQWTAWTGLLIRWSVSHSLPRIMPPISSTDFLHLLQCQCDWRRADRSRDDHWQTYSPGHFLLQVSYRTRLEICTPLVISPHLSYWLAVAQGPSIWAFAAIQGRQIHPRAQLTGRRPVIPRGAIHKHTYICKQSVAACRRLDAHD
jgi:hypothetical protein